MTYHTLIYTDTIHVPEYISQITFNFKMFQKSESYVYYSISLRNDFTHTHTL